MSGGRIHLTQGSAADPAKLAEVSLGLPWYPGPVLSLLPTSVPIPVPGAWLRIDPQSRDPTLAGPLGARVYDPLWLVGRQGQMLEQQAIDGGTPIDLVYEVASAPLTDFQGANSTSAEPFDATQPLECLIEREPVSLGLRGSAQMGLQFERFLREEFAQTGHDPSGVLAGFRSSASYGITATVPPDDLGDPSAVAFRAGVAGRITDGEAVYQATQTATPGGSLPSSTLPTAAIGAGGAVRTELTAALARFVRYRSSVYSEPKGAPSWVGPRLRYGCTVISNAVDSSSRPDVLAMHSSDYPGGTADWHTFDLGAAAGAVPQSAPAGLRTEQRRYLPHPIVFPGMPTSRFWEFEDGQTDWGSLTTEPVDVPKMLIAECSLLYGNDWLAVPVRLTCGTRGRINTVVVTDCFGQRVIVKPTADSVAPLTPPSPPWTAYTLSDALNSPDELVIPSASSEVLDGLPLETVEIVKDNAALIGWGIERTLPGALDRGVDAHSRYFRPQTAGPTVPSGATPSPAPLAPPTAPILYRLGTQVPDFWVPLLFENPAGSSVPYYRRGTVPGVSLRLGLLLQPQPVQSPAGPFTVEGHALPEIGVRLDRYLRWARGLNGSRSLWMARRARPGHGPGSSGLAFDLVLPSQGNATARPSP
ncbi:MAG: hypothetical protein L3K15_03655 [Thermoplasmata archaeon]|nr:hypothetical protein [Thermoplasmata archaeon]